MELAKAQVADLLGLSPRRIDQLVAEGIAVRTAPGRFDATATVRNYIEHVAAKAEKTKAALDAEYELARQRKASADFTELKIAERRGELLPVDEVVFGWSHILTSVRLGVLAVVPRLTQELGLTAEHSQALDTELRRALTELANDPLKSFASLDRAGDDEPAATAAAEALDVD